jgi:hypothetical protein
MNWYIIVGIVASFLLGWAVGIWVGTAKGYNAAIQEQAERDAQKNWENIINQFKGGKNAK